MDMHVLTDGGRALCSHSSMCCQNLTTQAGTQCKTSYPLALRQELTLVHTGERTHEGRL